MNDVSLDKRQKGLLEAFDHTEILKDVERHRFNVGNEGEDPIFHTIDVTPSASCEILFKWLEENEKVVLPHGVENKDNILFKRFKDQVYNAAAAHLDKNNEVLLPSGETVDISRVTVESSDE